MLFVAGQAVCPISIANHFWLAAIDEVHAVHAGTVVLGDLFCGDFIHADAPLSWALRLSTSALSSWMAATNVAITDGDPASIV